MVAVDTNVLVRALVDVGDRQSSKAERIVASGVWVSLVVLQEFVWVASRSYCLGHETIAGFIERFLAHQTIMLEQPMIVRSALDRFRVTPRLGFSDCLVLEVAVARGEKLMTFDRDLAKQEGAELA